MGRLGEFARGARGMVVVGALPTLAASLVPAAIAAFSVTHPDVVVLVHDDLNGQIVEGVLEGRIDIGITIEDATGKEVTFRKLTTDRLVAIGASKFNLPHSAISWRELAELPLIAFHPSSSIRQLTDHGFRQAGINFKPSYEIRLLATAGGLLGACLGVAALPELALRQLAIDPDKITEMAISPLISPIVTRELGLLTSSRRGLSPAANAFLQCLCAQARAFSSRTEDTTTMAAVNVDL